MTNIAQTYYPQSGKLIVLGAGESGVGAAILALQKGFEVLVSDKGVIAEKYQQQLEDAGITYESGHHSEELILNADLVVKSPGIPETAPLVVALKQKGIPVIGEIEFAAQYTNARLYCITGSNGKSTTTMLTYYILQKAGVNVGLAGNIGRSFALQVAQEKFDVYVLEISSFMLDDMYQFRADVAVILNITPDHLDRYDHKMENYVDSKFRMIRNQTANDYFIYCLDDEETVKGLERHHTEAAIWPMTQEQVINPGAYLDQEKNIIINTPKGEQFIMNTEDLSLQGKHNVYNNMAAGLVAKVQELRNRSMQESMSSYVNIPHRLEHVACIGGVNYINDSKATNVNSVWYALESFSPQIVLIMGGVDKGNDYEMLRDLVRSKVRAIICIGKDNTRIHESFEEDTDVIVNSSSMKDAVEIASHIAQKGDTVLLSPACASFDWFKNYEERGDKFKEAVMAL
ncbi:UDP-N-acetylmuramoyl-L-alanine--D-glutamate ligase [Sphingobacterium spiritivorum]|uniref:UDP-N-acetylmuramoylalanine--D-glutamate ligase n=1 Tax=Sphingobacterium spiritivorum ATCC 33861 TaxID=525373 RepID=D7VTY0_SPHSI|nr:UDP-N-acetylmuramoyl-L-alanine--D-glutamate ligase [Sphingobacterium spiritivorum]EFK55759.1 UDP-N-acetylmuramoyl-L-alanine--D-glutamate ligase [Sphingobacterium spiritivorum ATCC 33861]QQT34113.1 UDP-N-acetylmuramoyl-L-alanine--D-glutamate ligase [Sphingobacterium spiritivorum]WQD34947.1 UDP-N-acetylmuramoyl-L-alanine--D-glutamate ligase [Sphingobacterium spiritivorum]SUI98691.1 UDP-N-acetylmuramoylalanine--D-glutamate ligase [Sphingobacterium spiritivorum]